MASQQSNTGSFDIVNLQENFQRQQAKITTLRELVRKSEATQEKSTSSVHEKVKNIASELSHLKSKACVRHNLQKSVSVSDRVTTEDTNPRWSPLSSHIKEISSCGKIQLLKQQMEQNKLKIAKRESSKRELEEMVTQLKARIELERSPDLGQSMENLTRLTSTPVKNRFKSVADLSSSTFDLENEKIQFFENHTRLLEKQLGKDKYNLKTENNASEKIIELQEDFKDKECNRGRTSTDNFVMDSSLDKSEITIKDTKQNMFKIKESFLGIEESCKLKIEQLELKLQKSNKLNEIEQNICETEEADIIKNTEDDVHKIGLEKENCDLKFLLEQSQIPYQVVHDKPTENLVSSEYQVETQKQEIQNLFSTIKTLEERLTEQTIENNVLNANFCVLQEKFKACTPKSLFLNSIDDGSELEINKFKSQLDESYKSMIKMKLKIKQQQNEIDSFRKISDVHNEIIRLTEENRNLQQKLIEIEKWKNQPQSRLADGEKEVLREHELKKKIKFLETTCQNQTSAIQLLEEQKLDVTEKLNSTRQEIDALRDHMREIYKPEAVHVSDMEANQSQEQISELYGIINNQKLEIRNLLQKLQIIEQEKHILIRKVDNNMEKLSKSNSSEQSIETVEKPSQQERLQIEDFINVDGKNQMLFKPSLTVSYTVNNTDNSNMEQDLNENLMKLEKESSDLMYRIKALTVENQEHKQNISELLENRLNLEKNLEELKCVIKSVQSKYEKTLFEKECLLKEIKEVRISKDQIMQEVNLVLKENRSIQRTSDIQSLIEDCEKCLSRLDFELVNYKNSNDKNSKLNMSKKLAKEAKNVHRQVDDLLKRLKIDKISEGARNVVDLIHKCQEIENITADIEPEFISLKFDSKQKDFEIKRLNSEVNSLRVLLTNSDCHMTESKACFYEQTEETQTLRKELENKLDISNKEINILKDVVAAQREEIVTLHEDHKIELNQSLEIIRRYENGIHNLKAELKVIRSDNRNSFNAYNEKLQETTEELQSILKRNELFLAELSNDIALKQHTIDTLNKQIVDLRKIIKENENKIIERDDEIVYINKLFEANKIELDKVIKENEEIKRVVEKLKSDYSNIQQSRTIEALETKIKHLDTRIKELETTNNELTKNYKEQHEKLKKFAINLKKKVVQYNELEGKVKEMENMKQSFVDDTSISCYQAKISLLENTIDEYQKKYNNLKSLLTKQPQHYNAEIPTYGTNNQNLICEKSNVLQQHINLDSLEKQKIEHHDLKTMLDNNIEEKQNIILELQLQINIQAENIREKDKKISALSSEVDDKNIKFEKCKAIIKDKKKDIQKLIDENESLKQRLKKHNKKTSELIKNPEIEFDKLKEEHLELIKKYESEKKAFQNTMLKLQSVHSGIQIKLHEDLNYIESLETENNQYKENYSKLENCVTLIEERQRSLELCTRYLDPQAQRKISECKEPENTLVCRLNMLFENDNLVGQRLNEIQRQNKQLIGSLNNLKEKHNELLHKLYIIETEFQYFKTEKYETLKMEYKLIREQIEINKSEMDKMQQNYYLQLAKHAETGELKKDLNIQIETISEEKTSLQNNLDRTKDEIVELEHEILKLRQNTSKLEQIKSDLERKNMLLKMQNEDLTQEQVELQELRIQATHDKTKIDNLTHQLETLIQNHEFELNALKIQISELDSMRIQVSQNQTDDQVLTEIENKKLKELLADKDAIIESYQRQNLQLQMTLSSTSTSETDCQFTRNVEVTLNERYDKLENELNRVRITANDKDNYLKELLKNTNDIQEELNEMTKKYLELQFKYSEKQQEINSLKLYLKELNQFQETIPLEISKNISLEKPHDHKKSENSEQTVSDLEKFTSNPENVCNLKENVIELEKNKELETQFDKSVVEQPIVSTTAYTRQPKVLLESNEDRTWGSERLDLQDNREFEKKRTEYQEYIKELELERNILINEKIEMQVKSGKMLKKLKEYKNKIDQLTSASSSPSCVQSNNLDFTIQEEIKSQLNMSENQLVEIKNRLEIEILEKENLLKQIDILKDDNYRLMKTTEKQDVDIQIYQSQIFKLDEEIRNLNGGSNKFDKNKEFEKDGEIKMICSSYFTEMSKNITEIKRKLEDLRSEKDGLQVLLNEEKESNKSSENRIGHLQLKMIHLEKQLDDQHLANKNLNSRLNKYQTNINKLINEFDIIISQHKQLYIEFKNKLNGNNNKITTQNELVSVETDQEVEEITILELKMYELNSIIQYKDDEIYHLKQEIQNMTDNDQTNSLIEAISTQKGEINFDCKFVELKDKIELFHTDKDQSKQKMNIKISELDLTAELQNSLKLFKEKLNLYFDSKYSSKKCNSGEQLRDLETQLDKIIENGCKKIAENWKQQLLLKELQLKKVEKELEQIKSLTQCVRSSTIATNSDSNSETHKLQSVLESQEIEIITLKEQLALRSAECASLAAQHDFYSHTTASNSPFEMKLNSKLFNNKENVNLVPKSDLDLALYMLHQRDMRCEELTLELVNLLEERDTLQLRLSNSLRHIEDIKQKAICIDSGFDNDSSTSSISGPVNSTLQTENLTSDNNILEDRNELSAKLSELHTISHTRDKRIKEERDQRRRQMEQIQQDVANIPLEAVSELVATNLSNIKENPSTTLLNWLWGKPSMLE